MSISAALKQNLPKGSSQKHIKYIRIHNSILWKVMYNANLTLGHSYKVYEKLMAPSPEKCEYLHQDLILTSSDIFAVIHLNAHCDIV